MWTSALPQAVYAVQITVAQCSFLHTHYCSSDNSSQLIYYIRITVLELLTDSEMFISALKRAI